LGRATHPEKLQARHKGVEDNMNTAWISGRELNFPDLKVSNALLSNCASLEEALDRNDYLFFREVLDQNALAKL
jgi:hypothetical protein